MRAVVFEQFRGPLRVAEVPEPTPQPDGAVIEVKATGLCRSDWHGWQGHDADIRTLPHVPGHELAGLVVEVGSQVRRWRVGDRVTIPFVAGCGHCPECVAGHPQVCEQQFQPGFTAWGSFAQWVAVRYADGNLIRLPDELDFATAASLGCRMATAYRAVAQQGAMRPGEWIAIHGAGGVGLAAVAIAAALGARPIAVDIRAAPLALAQQLWVKKPSTPPKRLTCRSGFGNSRAVGPKFPSMQLALARPPRTRSCASPVVGDMSRSACWQATRPIRRYQWDQSLAGNCNLSAAMGWRPVVIRSCSTLSRRDDSRPQNWSLGKSRSTRPPRG